MAQLGSGNQSGYPAAIDTGQTFLNAVAAAPDSATRIDAEVINDMLAAILAIQAALGTNPQGIMGSVAARLNQFLPGSGPVQSLIGFTNRTALSVLGTTHHMGTAALLLQLYDAAAQAAAFEADTLTVDPSTFNISATFATAESGSLVIGAATPYIVTPFTAQTTVTVLGTTHSLGTADLFWQVYDPAGNVFDPQTLTVHPTTFDVVVTFVTAESGTLVLSAAGPRYATAFTSQTTVTISGATHGLGTRALLTQAYDGSTPRVAIKPATLTVDAVTFDVVLTFPTAQTGRVVLGAAGIMTGADFDVRDTGILNATAVRMYSQGGNLYLQEGAGEHVYILSKAGVTLATVDQTGKLGLGTATPAYQLQLTTDSAAKPTTTTWTISSDARLKEVLRPYVDGLATLLQIEPLWYRYNGQGGMRGDRQEHIGVLAQDLQPIAPYMVGSYRGKLTPESAETDLLTYEGHALSFMLVNAVKELHARVLALEAERATTHDLLAQLLARLESDPAC